ncbi:unnamed protein product [Acidithrix sp. C25]|nr:unnamed protein product [Acidithrix sp. C25]
MRMTRLVAKTQRQAPVDAEAISHRLLVRAGYIRRLSSGVYAYLPLGLRVLRKVEAIIRQEFDNAGAQEVLLPALQPVEIWEETNRSATMDDVLMRLEVRGGKFVLGPTHEEAVIAAVSPDLASYRDLPATVYQIQTKFRDEARPRFGLLRTREFVMADAYSFDESKEAMRESYRNIFDAYCRIFDRIGVEYYPVEADSGSIGGDVNHEFMVPAAIGEDHFASCSNCGYRANIEAAVRSSNFSGGGQGEVGRSYEVETGQAKSIDEVVDLLKSKGIEVRASETIKTMALKSKDSKLTLALVPGDRVLKVPHGYAPLSGEEFAQYPFLTLGSIGPISMGDRGVHVIADHSIVSNLGYVVGGNAEGIHILDAVLGRDFSVDDFDNLVVVTQGDSCPRCEAPMDLRRSVEAGHTFQLGLTYPQKIRSARFSGEDGSETMYFMGCYGIGVSRFPAVVAEVSNDDAGLIWPISIAPFAVHLVAINFSGNEEVKAAAEQIYGELSKLGIEVILDDRDVGAGVKLKDADLMGMPIHVVVGPKTIANGLIEIKLRSAGSSRSVPLNLAIDSISETVVELIGNSALSA